MLHRRSVRNDGSSQPKCLSSVLVQCQCFCHAVDKRPWTSIQQFQDRNSHHTKDSMEPSLIKHLFLSLFSDSQSELESQRIKSWTWGCQRWCVSEQLHWPGQQLCSGQGQTPSCTLISFQEEGNCSAVAMFSVPVRTWSNYQEPIYFPKRNDFQNHRGASFWKLIHYILLVCKVWLEKNGLELHPHFSNSSVSNQTDVIQHHCLRMSDYMIISSPPCWERLPPPPSSGPFTGKNFSGIHLFLFLGMKTVKA